MQTVNRGRHDVVIVGGRVAGSATAMLLARLGHDVAVVDQANSLAQPITNDTVAESGRPWAWTMGQRYLSLAGLTRPGVTVTSDLRAR